MTKKRTCGYDSFPAKEIKWISGLTSKPSRPYDYPEGFPYWNASGYAVLWGTNGIPKELKKDYPKELHRRKYLPNQVTFQGVDESGEITGFINVDMDETMPLRTILWIIRKDKNLRNVRAACNGR